MMSTVQMMKKLTKMLKNTELSGLRHRCPYTFLKSLHCITGFPKDALHDIILILILQVHEVVERIMASEIRHYEIGVLEESIIKYMELRTSICLDYPDLIGPVKPKIHYLVQYP